MENRWCVLYEIREMAKKNYVVIDLETTHLEGEVVQWAVVAPDGAVLGRGYVKPQGPITEAARAIHHISDEQVAEAPTFDQVAPQIWALLEGKAVVAYKASFEQSILYTSLCAVSGGWQERSEEVKERLAWLLKGCDWRCAMEWFAVIYGDLHPYFKTYTWQQLETAGVYFQIPLDHDGLHDAVVDAQLTARIVQKMRDLADQELPEGYHPPREEPCAGGCGEKSLFRYRYDEDAIWYCLECGLKAGVNCLCPRCEELGKRTIVTSYRFPKEVILSGTMCYQCQYNMSMASGAWHSCPRCTRVVEAPLDEKPYCSGCVAARAQERQKRVERKEELARYRQNWYDETRTLVNDGKVIMLEEQPVAGDGNLLLARHPELLTYDYFTRSDVEPILIQPGGNEPATLVLKQQGVHGHFEVPHIDHIVFLADMHLVAVLITFHTASMYSLGGGKYAITAKGQFYRYFLHKTTWEQVTWKRLSGEHQARVIEAWEARKIDWARRPGKKMQGS